MANLSNINNILRTGSLGVGINRDPASPFEVSSATKPGIKMFNTATNGKTYQAYSDQNGNYIIYDEDADDNRFIINTSGNATFAGNVSVIGSAKFIEVGSVNTGTNFGFMGWNAASKYLFLGNSYNSAYNENLVINSSGNVGINADAPSEKLEVKSGSIFVNGEDNGIIVDSISKRVGLMKYAGHEGVIARASTNDFGIVRCHTADIFDGSSLTYDFYVSGTGNVGIGVTDPDAKLEIKGTGASTGLTFKTTDSLDNETFYIKDGGVVGVRYYPFKIGVPSGTANVANTRLQIATTGGDFVVLNDGKTGIGTDSPNAKLEVITSTAGYASIIRNTNGANDSNGLLVKAGTGATEYALKVSNTNDTTNFMVVKGNGNVGIGTTSPNAALTVVDNSDGSSTPLVIASGDGSFDVNQEVRLGFSQGPASSFSSSASLGQLAFAYTGGAFKSDFIIKTNTTNASDQSEKMRITSRGEVGIGITPNVNSNVVNVIQLGKGMTLLGNVNDDRATMAANLYLDTGTAFRYVMDGLAGRFSIEDGKMIWGTASSGTAGTVATVDTKMTLLNNGNVGINSDNPGQKLAIEGSATGNESVLRVNNQANVSSRIWLRNSAQSAYIFNSGSTPDTLATGILNSAFGLGINNNSPVQFYNGLSASVKMTILPSGNVGIGRTQADEKLEVEGSIKAKDVDGKIYSMVASWSYVASKNDLFSFAGTEGALWEYTIRMNPNTAGSGSYRDFYYGKLGIGIGWNGSNVTQYIWQQQDQTAPRTLYDSGGGNFNPLFRMYYSGGIYTQLAYGTAWTLRIQGLSTTTFGDVFFRRLA